MPQEEGFPASYFSGILWCHCCHRASGQQCDASRPVCPYCSSGFVEVIGSGSHGVEEKDEVVAQGIQFHASLGTIPGECLWRPGPGQWLQESGESRSGRRGPTPASSASMDALEVVEVIGEDVGNMCMVCMDQFKLGEYVLPLPCTHLYHSGCIFQWFEGNNSCPVCRFKMPIGVPVSDRRHSGCQNETFSSGRRLSTPQRWPFRSMTIRGQAQAQGQTSSRPASSTESVSGSPGNGFDVDTDGDVIMHDA